MFGARKKGGRKGKAPYTPPTAASVNPNAATAAVSAYNLSASAAAAALRALPPPRTDVAAVQTKRAQRRSASVSSQGSRRALSPVPSIRRMFGGAGAGAGSSSARVASPTPAPTLRRRGSNASLMSMSSMSERTFRSPSPHRFAPPSVTGSIASDKSAPSRATAAASAAVNAAGAAAAVAVDRSGAAAGGSRRAGGPGVASRSRSVPPQSTLPPPVPSLPKHIAGTSGQQQQPKAQAQAQPDKRSRRATTLGLVQQPLRLASQTQKDAAATTNGHHTATSSWFGSAAVGHLADVRTADAPMDIHSRAAATASPTPATGADGRPSSRSSSLVNFSYPSRQRLASASPPSSPTLARAGLAAEAPVVSPVSVPAARPARRAASTSRITGRHSADEDLQALVYDPNSRRMVPRAQLRMLEQVAEGPRQPAQQRQQPAQQQPRRKKQQQQQQQQGVMAAASSRGAKAQTVQQPPPARPAQQPTEPAERQPASPEPERQPPTAPNFTESAVEYIDEPAQPVPALSPSPSTPSSSVSSLPGMAAAAATSASAAAVATAVAATPATTAATTAALYATTASPASSVEDAGLDATYALPDDGRPSLVKRPSVVREEPEREEEEERQHRQARVRQAKKKRSDLGSRQAGPEDQDHLPTAETTRAHSPSPARTARFSPVVKNNLTACRHSPPPRSISPRKSALKHTSPPRNASPTDPEANQEPSAASALAPAAAATTATAARKKANRVSFDDKAVVVPQSPIGPLGGGGGVGAATGASSPSPPPFLPGAPSDAPSAAAAPSRSRSWFSNIGRSKKKSGADFAPSADLDDDVVMKPRPALPSFGSVRDKVHPGGGGANPPAGGGAGPAATAQLEERPLVRPVRDATDALDATDATSLETSGDMVTPLETLSTSSDHAIGSILAAGRPSDAPSTEADAGRDLANTVRPGEPLPPVVTSVEGTGYDFDNEESPAYPEFPEHRLPEGNGVASHSGGYTGVSSEEDDEHQPPVLRFDEQQATTVPAGLAEDPASPTDLPSPTSTKSPRKTVPAITISYPSQENLIAVRGTGEEEEDDDDGVKGNADSSQVPTVSAPSDVVAGPSTPSPKKHSPVRFGFDVPGMFPPDSDTDSPAKISPTRPAFYSNDGGDGGGGFPARQLAFEPTKQADDLAHTEHTPATVFATHTMPTVHEDEPLTVADHDAIHRDDDDEDSEVFSDAYEDLSDIEGDGFLSLDAVVDSPIGESFPGTAAKEKSAAPTPAPTATASAVTGTAASAITVAAMSNAMRSSQAAARSANGTGAAAAAEDGEEDWDKVRSFWRSLTAERRAQLEKEAREDAAADGDLEEGSSAGGAGAGTGGGGGADPKKSPRRKKSAETRLAEKKAILESGGPVLLPQQQQQKQKAQPVVEHESQQQAAKRIRQSMRDGGSSKAGPSDGAKTTARSAAGPSKAAVGTVPGGGGGGRPAVHVRTFSADSESSIVLQPLAKSSSGGGGGGGGVPGLLPSALRRRGSDSSESSFKRTRAGIQGAGFASGSTPAAGGSNGNGLHNRSSRFSLRSLSPTGSTTLRGSTESSPQQFRRTMRDGSSSGGGHVRQVSAPVGSQFASSTLRKGGAGGGGSAADGSGGFFSSLGGKKRGSSKLVPRGSSSVRSMSRFGDSSDDDDDDDDTGGAFARSNPRGGGGGSGVGGRTTLRSASAGGASTFRSRFVDSSDEDEVIPDRRTVGGGSGGSGRPSQTSHVVPKTLRTNGGSSLRSASARPPTARPAPARPRPASVSVAPANPPLREEAEDDEEKPWSYRTDSNLGTTSLRRSRSGRGQLMSPTTTAAVPTTAGAAAVAAVTNGKARAAAGPSSQRRSSSIMSVLWRRKAHGSDIQRPELVDSAARRDTQLERSTRELAAVRSNSLSKRQRGGGRAGKGVAGADADEDDDEDSDGEAAGASSGAGAGWPLPGPAAHTTSFGGSLGDLSYEGKKKKFPALRRMFRLDD